MELGLALPQCPAFTVRRVAAEAEAMGYDGLWVGDRALVPVHPRDPYPGGGDIPEAHRGFRDPFAVLSYAAAVTDRVRLGTSCLNAPWYPPVLLARSLATIDRLSGGGRLRIGLGLGWSPDEYAAVGAGWPGRAARLESCLDALDALWAADPVRGAGDGWHVPPSYGNAKPAGRPPRYLAGFTGRAVERAARRADGWLAPPLPGREFARLRDILHRAAAAHGRDPAELRIIQRVTPARPPDQRAAAAAARSGADELILDLQHCARSDDELLAQAGKFRAAVDR